MWYEERIDSGTDTVEELTSEFPEYADTMIQFTDTVDNILPQNV